MKQKLTRGIAKSLRDFGYPDVTSEMVAEVWDAYEKGDDLPHDVIGMFVKRQLDEIAEIRPDLISPPA